MLPLVWGAPQHHGVLHPDAYAGDVKAGFLERPAEGQPLGIRMEDVGGCTLRQMRDNVLEGGEDELIKGGVLHFVVLDFERILGLAHIIAVVGRVGQQQIGLDIAHERMEVILAGRVTA